MQHSLYYISGQGLVLQTPKTHSEKRNISITNEMIGELQSYKVKKQEQLLKVGLKLMEHHFVVSAFWRRTSQSQYDTQAISL
ncbi:site-specific integrase [Peribacillus butanolivorans]|uniref:hypothetical protein n=1 Tax=Peribacillus butanolivorans TaxID=421767 RepID=UPI0036CA3F61